MVDGDAPIALKKSPTENPKAGVMVRGYLKQQRHLTLDPAVLA